MRALLRKQKSFGAVRPQHALESVPTRNGASIARPQDRVVFGREAAKRKYKICRERRRREQKNFELFGLRNPQNWAIYQ